MVTDAVKPWFISGSQNLKSMTRKTPYCQERSLDLYLLLKIYERELNKTNKTVNFG